MRDLRPTGIVQPLVTLTVLTALAVAVVVARLAYRLAPSDRAFGVTVGVIGVALITLALLASL